MTPMKRWIIVGSSLAALGGVGVGGYTQRELLLGDAAEVATDEAAAEEGVADSEAAPPKPITLSAAEEGEMSPLPSNPLRAADERVVRGNDESSSLPAPNFTPAPVTDAASARRSPFGARAASAYSNGEAAAEKTGHEQSGQLTPPPSMPAEVPQQDPTPSAPASEMEGDSQQFSEPIRLADSADATRSRFSDGAAAVVNDSSSPNNQQRPAPIAQSIVPVEEPTREAAPQRFAPPSTNLAPLEQSPPIGTGVSPQPSAAAGFGAATTRSTPAPAAKIQSGAAVEGSAVPGSQQLDGPQTPSLSIEKYAPDEIQIGKPVKFEIKVKNTGQATATNVIVRDSVPRGTRLIDTTPQSARQSGGEIAWQLDILRPGEEKSVTMQLMPVGEGEIGSVATVSFSAQASVRTRSTRPQLLLEATAPRQVMIGEQVKLSVRLSNPGTGAATRVVLEEDVPQGLSHPAGRALEFEAGTLKPGETRELELTLTASAAGIVQNLLRARADANLNVEARTDLEVIAPKLAVNIDGPSKRYLERQASHQIVISNPGTAAARDIEMVAHLPKGLKFVSANNQGQYDANGHAVYWSLEQLTPSNNGTVELTTLPMDAGQQKIRVESKASMNLSAAKEHVVEVEGLAALFFEVADAADPIEVGGETVYEVRVINQGSKTSTNVRLAAALPPALKPLEAGGATGGVISGQQVVFEPLARLAPKADALFRIRVQGVASGNQRVRVQLSSDEIPSGVTKEESTRVYQDE